MLVLGSECLFLCTFFCMMFLSGRFASGDIREEFVNRLMDPFRDKKNIILYFFLILLRFLLYFYIGSI